MPVLKNVRWEQFAQNAAKGMPDTKAYEAAGYKPNDGNCGRLRRFPEVSARIAELLEFAAEKTGVTVERIIEELAKIGFANMQDYMRGAPDGDPYLDFSALTRDQAAALAEVTVEDYKEGRGKNARDVKRVKFKLHDKRAALVDLGKHLGMFKDRIEVSGKDGGPIEFTGARERLAGLIAGEVAAAEQSKDP